MRFHTTGLVLLILASFGIAARAETQASSPALRAILEAEAKGNFAERQKLLDELAQQSTDDEAAHWEQGLLREGKLWKKFDEHVAAAKTKKALTDYRALRAKSEPTLKSQQELAAFCRKHNLKPQERVHLTAILELDPENEDVRKRLGYDRIDGRWQLHEEVQAAQKAAARAALALKQHRTEIVLIREGLANGKITRDEAVKQLIAMEEPGLIAAWESLLSPLPAGADAVVETLKQLPYPEATQSLARHALFSPGSSEKATAALTDRDEHAYIPQLLAEMRSPWLATLQLLQAPDGRLLYRHSVYSDGQDKQQLAVFDQAFFLTGNLFNASVAAAGEAAGAARLSEAQRASENSRIEQLNARITKLLRTITQEKNAESPQDWWLWWNDRNEIHVSGNKPLQQSYAFTSSVVVGQEPLPSLGSPFGTPRAPGRQSKDCLAGGTPIVTELGPIAVDRIRMGDLVLAKHELTGELAFKPVLRTTVRAPEKLIRIQVGEETIRASGGHPFWVTGQGWTRARELKAGMVLHGASSPSEIKSIVEEEEPAKTFNLVVADFHSYFAGSAKVLSHDNTVRGSLEQIAPGVKK
jgi:hypothetical protein